MKFSTSPLHPNRRTVVTAAALAATGGALAGCSSDDGGDPGASDGGGASGPPAGEGKTEYPLTLETNWGETTLEQRPERIAAVTMTGIDSELLASLGIAPVVANTNIEQLWITDALGDGALEDAEIYPPDPESPIPFETVAAAEPDLIVVAGNDLTDTFEQLSTIAPVLAPGDPGDERQSIEPWQEYLTAIGEALDLQDAAQKVIDDTEAGYEEIRADHPEFEGLTPTFIVYYGGDFGTEYWSTPGSAPEEVLVNMGFEANPNAEKFAEDAHLSDELWGDVDADVILFSDNSTLQGGDGDESTADTVLEQPLFEKLDAVRNGHLLEIENHGDKIVVDGTDYEGNVAWALARSGPLSGPFAARTFADPLKDLLS